MKWLTLFFGFVLCRQGAMPAWLLPSPAGHSASANLMKCVPLPLGACSRRSMAPRFARQMENQGVALVVLTWLVHQNKGTL